MPKSVIYTHSDFLARFLEADFPLTIGQDTVGAISKATKPLPPEMIDEHLLPLEEGQINDEFTEFVACYKLTAEAYEAIIYWRADLLQYHYVLATLDAKTGKLIDRRVIAGTTYIDGELTQSSAAITEDMTIYVVSGQGAAGDYDYEASGSTATRLQVSEGGKIMEL
ncbi:MAG: hypothetical protein AAF544_12660 [Bacteroidota bacterium]